MRDNNNNYQWDKTLDVRAEVDEIERLVMIRKRRHYRRTELDRYRGELGQLYNAGMSCAQLVFWLKHRKKITISRSSVHRKLQQWPEIKLRKKGQPDAQL